MPSRLFSHLHLLVAAQAGLEFVCVFGHDAIVKPTALGPVANTDTKLLIYGLFQKGRVLAQDGVDWVDEPLPGYPKRPVPRNEETAKALKKRTMTNLYNARPQWLADAHDALDAAVAAAYGWSAGISDEDALRELLALNDGGP